MKSSLRALIFGLMVTLFSCHEAPLREYYDTGELRFKGRTQVSMPVSLLTEYYKDGTIKAKIWYSPAGTANGETFAYHQNTVLAVKAYYLNGELSGPVKIWDTKGRIKYEGQNANNERHGEWFEYDTLGRLIDTIHYDYGVQLDTIVVTEKK